MVHTVLRNLHIDRLLNHSFLFLNLSLLCCFSLILLLSLLFLCLCLCWCLSVCLLSLCLSYPPSFLVPFLSLLVSVCMSLICLSVCLSPCLCLSLCLSLSWFVSYWECIYSNWNERFSFTSKMLLLTTFLNILIHFSSVACFTMPDECWYIIPNTLVFFAKQPSAVIFSTCVLS